MSLAVICLVCYICKEKTKEKKAKNSDTDLSRVDYEAMRESVRILEGVDPLEELQRRTLVARLEDGIERPVEDLGFLKDDPDMLDFVHENVTYLD